MNTDLSTSVAKRQPACLAFERYHPRIPVSQRTCLCHVSVPLGSQNKTPQDFIRSFYCNSHSYCIYSNISLRCTSIFQAVKLNKNIFSSSLLKIGSNGVLMDRKLQCAQSASNIFYNRAIFGIVHKIAKRLSASPCLSVCTSILMEKRRHPMDGFFKIFYILSFLEILSRKFKFMYIDIIISHLQVVPLT
jgi:hypothetical protein